MVYLFLGAAPCRELACSVQSEGDYLASAVLHNDTPSKLWMSAAAADEIDDLQHYTWLLAHHDLAVSIASGSSQAPFAEAAFDLASSAPHLVQSGMKDLAAFLSPAQQHAFEFIPAVPLAWGHWLHLCPTAQIVASSQPCQSIAQPSELPPAGFTIWLTTPLRGGMPKRGRAGGDDEGDNGTDPTASSSSAPPPNKKAQCSVEFCCRCQDSFQVSNRTYAVCNQVANEEAPGCSFAGAFGH